MISFIIPIYNTPEKKLVRCFESIVRLNTMEYEVILVDDGSDFFIERICNEYVVKDNHFKYFYKTNAGVSAARNFGIEQATGKYIAFVDSDDEIIPEAYDLYNTDINDDLIIFSMKYQDEKLLEEDDIFYNKVTPKDVLKSIIVDTSIGGPCAKLIKRDILFSYNIRFDETMKVAEDADFICRILYKATSIIHSNRQVYIYDYIADSGNNRIIKFPEITFDNYKHIYHQKLNGINILGFDETEKVEYSDIIGNDTIDILGECTGVLKLYGKLSNQYKENTLELFEELEKNTSCRSGKKNKIYYVLLKKKLWILLAVIAKLRLIYQKIILKI